MYVHLLIIKLSWYEKYHGISVVKAWYETNKTAKLENNKEAEKTINTHKNTKANVLQKKKRKPEKINIK